MNINIIQKIPKVELHCHLDGSVSMQALNAIANGVDSSLANKISAPVPCGSLAEYLQCFDVILPLLQTERALEMAAYDVIRQAASEHVVYMEVRFAPGLHCQNGLNEAEACNAVLRGLELGERDFGVKSRAILCMMRGKDAAYNLQTLETAKAFLQYGVCGVDLAGNEVAYPPALYRDFFDKASRHGIPFTIHAGECGSSQNVRYAVEMGARRIGHGVAVADDEETKALCKKHNICFEMCPISNFQTKAVPSANEHPFLRMRREGLCATIHTDNRTVSSSSLTQEWEFLSKTFDGIDEDMVRSTNIDAARAAFLPENEIRKIVHEIEKSTSDE